jgi:hypothetical protein
MKRDRMNDEVELRRWTRRTKMDDEEYLAEELEERQKVDAIEEGDEEEKRDEDEFGEGETETERREDRFTIE